jgi:hypothetical protein
MTGGALGIRPTSEGECRDQSKKDSSQGKFLTLVETDITRRVSAFDSIRAMNKKCGVKGGDALGGVIRKTGTL